MIEKKRVSGILTPLSCLPGPYGIGDLGKEARQFVDWMKRSGIRQWSLLPLNPTSYGNSPYQSPSAFAGNIYYISPELLEEDGLLSKEELEAAACREDDCRVDYGKLFAERPKLLFKAYERFIKKGGSEGQDYIRFCGEHQDWLEDYAAFMTIKEKMDHLPWQQWPEALAGRREPEFSAYLEQWKPNIDFWKFTQFVFFRQWDELRKYANKQEVEIIGDLPFYIAHDSADVWSHRELFAVDKKNGSVRMWAGVPADAFCDSDRNWGNPVYQWEAHEADGYQWFRRRIRISGRMYDGLRIDHVIAIRRFFGIRDGEKNGSWYDGPDMKEHKLSQAMQEEAKKAGMFIIAEDLGEVPPGLREHIREIGWSGMRVLQFAFTGKYGAKSDHLPFCHDRDMVIYTGTHDHPTLKTFLEKKTDKELRYLKWWTGKCGRSELRWALIEEAYKSVADQVIIPIQDILGLGDEARMVFSDDYERSWRWRLTDFAVLDDALARRLKRLAVLTGRCPASSDAFADYLGLLDGRSRWNGK